MNQIAILIGSIVAVLLLALAAKLLRLGGARLHAGSEACEVAESTFADFEANRVWLDVDGESAVVAGKDGSYALVRRHGAHFIGRRSDQLARAEAHGPVVTIPSGERLLAPFVIRLESEEEARLLTSLLGSRPPDG